MVGRAAFSRQHLLLADSFGGASHGIAAANNFTLTRPCLKNHLLVWLS